MRVCGIVTGQLATWLIWDTVDMQASRRSACRPCWGIFLTHFLLRSQEGMLGATVRPILSVAAPDFQLPSTAPVCRLSQTVPLIWMLCCACQSVSARISRITTERVCHLLELCSAHLVPRHVVTPMVLVDHSFIWQDHGGLQTTFQFLQVGCGYSLSWEHPGSRSGTCDRTGRQWTLTPPSVAFGAAVVHERRELLH